MKETVLIREMKTSDLPDALDLVEAVGWNQTARDWNLFLTGKNNTSLVAEAEGQIVGTVASIQYGREVAWISMMIVAEAFRGRGISKLLLNTLIGRLRSHASGTIKLDATPAGRPVYLKLGFREEYVIHRFIHDRLPEPKHLPGHDLVHSLTRQDRLAAIKLDRHIFGAERQALVDRLHNESPACVIKREDQIAAYAFGRKGRMYDQIGPVGGERFEDIRPLLSVFMQALAGRAVVVDVPADKTALIEWLRELGFVHQRFLYRMFLEKNRAPGRLESLYCIAGPEFG
jgi:ribosomal protein S18 acetylase RimI-like enzyme